MNASPHDLSVLDDRLDSSPSDVLRRFLMILIAIVALTVPAAYFNGRLLSRWGDDASLTQHAELLANVPRQVGEWVLVEDGEPISSYLIEQLELRGTLHRIYEHQQTGQHVALLVLVGPPGPLVRHPPEICYQTRANELLRSEDLPVTTAGHREKLRLLAYRSALPGDGDFYVAYGFGYDGRWDIPASPRLAYGGCPFLFKLHVLTDQANETQQRPTGLEAFLADMLPELSRTLMPEASQIAPATQAAAN